MSKISGPSKAQLKHREIFGEMKNKIDSGEWVENRAIPTERELAYLFYCSRTTLRKAIDSLKQRGYLHSVHGQGTFVLPFHSRANHLLHSFTDDVSAKGGKPTQRILDIGFVPINDFLHRHLMLAPHIKQVFFVKRIRYIGSTPLGIQSSWLALDEGSAFSEEELLMKGSLYALLEESTGIKLLEAAESISARQPSPNERTWLELAADEVVLSCTRVTLSVERKPVEYVEMVYAASRYSYKIRITKDSFSA